MDIPDGGSFDFETVTVLYPDTKDLSDDIAASLGGMMKLAGNVPTDL
jgi:hypothetical protein